MHFALVISRRRLGVTPHTARREKGYERKGDLDPLNFFNSWIAVRQADGWLEQHRHYWFETREWADRVATDPDTIAECDESFQ